MTERKDEYDLHRISRSRSETSSDDDDADDPDQEGLIDLKPGDTIRDGRYKVLGLAGQGTFGTVLDCVDTKRNERSAIKVVRSVKRYLEAAYVEIDILEKIKAADPKKKSGCVRLLSHFEIKKDSQRHVCLEFEKLGRSLYEFIKHNKYRGFRLDLVRTFSQQLIKAVAFCHSIKLIHTDLKPENILLVRSDYTVGNEGEPSDYRVPVCNEIRLIDFGGATFEDDHHSRIINTRQYRSPEVLLGLGWSYPSDLWSVGCILAELYTGELLFGTHEDMEHLALMEKVLGKQLPVRITKRALRPYLSRREYDSIQDEESRRSRRSRSGNRGRSRSRSRSRNRYRGRRSSSYDSRERSYNWSRLFDDGRGRREREREGRSGRDRGRDRDRDDDAWRNYDSRGNAGGRRADRWDRERDRDRDRDRERDRRDRDRSYDSYLDGRADATPADGKRRGRSASQVRADKLLNRHDARLRWPEGASSRESRDHVRKAKTLEQLIPDADFRDLLRGLLDYNPRTRLTAREALEHRFFLPLNTPSSSSSSTTSSSSASASSSSSSESVYSSRTSASNGNGKSATTAGDSPRGRGSGTGRR